MFARIHVYDLRMLNVHDSTIHLCNQLGVDYLYIQKDLVYMTLFDVHQCTSKFNLGHKPFLFKKMFNF